MFTSILSCGDYVTNQLENPSDSPKRNATTDVASVFPPLLYRFPISLSSIVGVFIYNSSAFYPFIHTISMYHFLRPIEQNLHCFCEEFL